jgi:hypothetical protein
MTAQIHSIWLMPAAADELFLSNLVSRLSNRFATPLFAPHLTVKGDTDIPVAQLAGQMTRAAEAMRRFSLPVLGVETSEAFFRSFYARFEVSASLAALKAALDPAGLAEFMPHVSLLYGPVEAGAKAGAAAEFQRLLAGRQIAFDRLCVVRSGQDIPIEDWAVVSTEMLAA